jgi:hypothetical protein
VYLPNILRNKTTLQSVDTLLRSTLLAFALISYVLATFILEKENLQNIIRMMKSNNKELVGRMARMESRVHTGF